MLFFSSADYSYLSNYFQKDLFQKTTNVSNRLDPDHAIHFVGPKLHPNCLKRLSADVKKSPTMAEKVNVFTMYVAI